MSLEQHIHELAETCKRIDERTQEELRQYAKLHAEVNQRRKKIENLRVQAQEMKDMFALFGMEQDDKSTHIVSMEQELAKEREEVEKSEAEIKAKKRYGDALSKNDYKEMWEIACNSNDEADQITSIYCAFANGEKSPYGVLKFFYEGKPTLSESVYRYLLAKAVIAIEQKSSKGKEIEEFDTLFLKIVNFVPYDKKDPVWKNISAYIRIREMERIITECERRLQHHQEYLSDANAFIRSYEEFESRMSKELEDVCATKVRGKRVSEAISAAKEWEGKSFGEMHEKLKELRKHMSLIQKRASRLNGLHDKLIAAKENGVDEKTLAKYAEELDDGGSMRLMLLREMEMMRNSQYDKIRAHSKNIQNAVQQELDKRASNARSRIERRENTKSWMRRHFIIASIVTVILLGVVFTIGRMILFWDRDRVEEHNYVRKELSLKELYSEIPEDALYWNGHYYQIYDGCKTWEEARDYCESLGGHLATVGSQDENNVICNFFPTDSYIGYQDNEEEGVWEWVTGEPTSYTAWEYSENKYSGILAGMNRTDYALLLGNQRQWRAEVFDGKESKFICEWDTAPGIFLSTDVDMLQSDVSFLEQLLMRDEAYVENGYAYYVLNGCSSTQEMLDKCAAVGGELVTLQSDEESAIVKRAVEFCGWNAAVIGMTTAHISGTEECYWYWYNGETANYTCWGNGAPREAGYIDQWAVIDITRNDWWTTAIEPVTTFVCEWKLDPEMQIENEQKDMSHVAFYADCSIPENAFYWNGHYYSVYNDAASIADAAERCAAKGGHLATILTEEENNVLFQEYLKEYTYADIYIGYTQSEGTWQWPVDIDTGYENWSLDASYSDGTCAMFSKGNFDGSWSKGSLSDPRDIYVCEWDYVNRFGYGQDSLLKIDAVRYNGHCYALLNGANSWEEAQAICEDFGGHLATISSIEENVLIMGLNPGVEVIMLGMTDKETEGDWKWVTGEPVNFLKWASGEPNNQNGSQDYMVMYENGAWDDRAAVSYFVCEWDVVPEVFEHLTDVAESGKIIPANAHSFNGHYYYAFDCIKTWEEAKAFCERLGGYLAVITTAEENAAILPWIPSYSKNDVIAGMTDKQNEGVWVWINGEQSDYFPWAKGEPNNQDNEDYLAIRKSGEWNDVNIVEGRYFLCEWDG